eukprot:CAMPEP_0185041702 /NCGR_PEP_ID=MMETSP1103-20130426/41364_1 /TAXON_ID=36769 /ORGANISM="Paraphysomonas bandaiensis, Strain Caron Lab Isolate" /LENGTH=310 /DNA_ID=CAMNT_0027581559 /DNA_START=155 /DNA_END=1087 /DNA_ORIENTATION=-
MHAKHHNIDRQTLQLEDGGTVALDWLTGLPLTEEKSPIVVLIHGLCGSSESPHIVYAGHEFKARGYTVCAFISRGCGGLPLTTPESFTAARTSDLAEALEHIRSRYPDRRLCAVGYSLGAGILLKYVGERGDRSLLSSAVAVSPSWNFLKVTPWFQTWSSTRLVEGLRGYLLDHMDYLKNHENNRVRIAETLRAKDVREFDHHAVVPVHGYRDVDHYYQDSSAVHHAHNITTPTLALSAEDDPVCAVEGRPMDISTYGDGLVVVTTRTGGHVAFTRGIHFFSTRSWMDDVAIEWLEANQAYDESLNTEQT